MCGTQCSLSKELPFDYFAGILDNDEQASLAKLVLMKSDLEMVDELLMLAPYRPVTSLNSVHYVLDYVLARFVRVAECSTRAEGNSQPSDIARSTLNSLQPF